MPYKQPLIPANKVKLNSVTKGAIQELRVSVDLMNKKFYVFRAFSQSTPFDLVAFFKGRHFLIDVKSGCHHFKTGTIYRGFKKRHGITYAICLSDKIIYSSKYLQ